MVARQIPNADPSGCEPSIRARTAWTPTYKPTVSIASTIQDCALRSSRSAAAGSRCSLLNRQTRTPDAEESSSALRAKPARARLPSSTETNRAAAPTTPFQAIVKYESRRADTSSAARFDPTNARFYARSVSDAWLLWLAIGIAAGLFILLAAAGLALMGAFLATVTWLAGRSATKPESRAEVDESMRRVCDRLPFCNCSARSTS